MGYSADFFVELGREKVQFDLKTVAAFQMLLKNEYCMTAFLKNVNL